MSDLVPAVRRLADAIVSWATELPATPPLRWTGRLWVKPIIRSRGGAFGPNSRAFGFMKESIDSMTNQLAQIEGSTSLLKLDAERQRLGLSLFDVTATAQRTTALRAEIQVPKSILDMPENQRLGQFHTHRADAIAEGVFDPERLATGDPSGKVLRPGRWD